MHGLVGGEAAGWPLLSSSHVEVVISSRQRRPSLVARADNVKECKILLDNGPELLSALEGVKPFP